MIEKPLRRLRVGSVLRVGSSADGKHQDRMVKWIFFIRPIFVGYAARTEKSPRSVPARAFVSPDTVIYLER